MHYFPGTPQTLPCGDEDPLFNLYEDVGVDNDSVGANIGESTPFPFVPNGSHQETLSLPASSKTALQPKVLFPGEDAVSTTALEMQQHYKNLPSHESMKKKRRQYRSKLLSRCNLSQIIKSAIQPHSKPSASPHRSSRHQETRNSLKDKDRSYHFLEDEEELRDMEYLEEDRSSAVSLPIFSSLSRKIKRSSDNSSSASTSAVQLSRASSLKWKRLLNADSLATFRKSDSFPTAELTSSSSVVSSIASCYSAPVVSRRFDEGDAQGFLASSSDHVPLRQEYLLNSRVDEDDEEDTDVEDDDHPAAGSFAFAIGRGEC